MRSVSDERFFHMPSSSTPRCLPQVRSVIATKGFHTFYDAEASALAAVSGGRRCEDLERRKAFTHSMTRKRQRWQPPPQVAAARPQGGRRAAAGRPQGGCRPPPQAAAAGRLQDGGRPQNGGRPQMVRGEATEGFHTFYDAEASAFAAASGGRRCKDLEPRKVFTNSMTRKRQRLPHLPMPPHI